MSSMLSYSSAYPVIKETIPRSRLGYATNPVYEGFPPLMSDGRSITASYQSTSVVDKVLREQGDFSHWEYRQYLQKNGQNIMRDNFLQSSNDCGYYRRLHNDASTSIYTKRLDKPIPIQEKSDLKSHYLTREELHVLNELR